MKRRSFLTMLGLAPMAAAAGVRLGEIPAQPTGAIGTDALSDLTARRIEFDALTFRNGAVSLEKYVDFDGLVPGPNDGVRDSTGYLAVTHFFVAADGAERLVWIR